MRFTPRAALTLAVLLLTLMPAAAPAGDPMVEHAVSLVSQGTYQFVHSGLLYTHDGHNRGFGVHHDWARNNIVGAFQSYGLVTTMHEFTYQGNPYYNVVGELVGTSQPFDVYIVGAHFDSVNNPGADDNASGTAAIMEMARLASQWQSEATIRFIAFDREEQGLVGSEAYVEDHAGDNILGMLSLDMIAYSGATPDEVAIYGHTGSGPLKSAVSEALGEYADITGTVHGSFDASNHAPFEWAGFQAALIIEADFWGNPHYHQQSDSVDTPGYIDYEYAITITRGVFAWLVQEAGLTPPPPAGDLNCDFAIDFADINPFVLALSNPDAYDAAFPTCDRAAADCNDDGLIDFKDINPFVLLLAE